MTIPSQQTPAERWAARKARRRTRRDPRMRAAYWMAASVVLFAIAVVYLVEPSKKLPHFLPGYDPNVGLHQIAHAVMAGFFSIVAFFGALASLVSGGIPDVQESPSSHIHTVPPGDRDR